MVKAKTDIFLIRKPLFLLIFYMSIGYSSLFAQNSPLDSLKNLLKNHPQEDSIQVEIMTELAFRFYQTALDSTLFFATQANRIAQKIGYKRGEGRSLGRIALGYSVKGDYISALDNYIKARDIAKQTNDKQGTSASLNNIGYIYRVLGRYEEALEYTLQSLALSKEMNWQRGVVIGNGNVAWLLERMGKYEDGFKYAQKAVELSNATNDGYLITTSVNVLGKIYQAKQDYANAFKYYQIGLDNAKKANLKQQVAFNSLGIGEIYTIQKKTEQAIVFLQQAIDFAYQSQSPDIVRDASLTLMKVYRNSNDHQRAFVYYDIYSNIRDSLFNIEKQNEVRRLEFEHKTQEQEQKINDLGLTKQKQAKEIENQKIIFYNLIIILLLVGLLALSLFGNRIKDKKKNKELMRQNLEIEKQKEALAKQTDALQESNLSKDKIFSIVAHDLRSPLSSLKNTITLFERNMFSEEEVRETLPKLKKHLNNTFELTDELLYWAKNQMNVVSFEPEKIDLPSVFEEQLNRFEEAIATKKVRMDIDIPTHLPYIKADIDMLKTILRNLITNAIKFCRADDQITLSATENDEFVTMIVADTGIGIPQENIGKLFVNQSFSTRGTAGERGTGLGLSLCKDFVERNGGKIWFESTQGKGTTFYFTMPKHKV
jgi:two-component system, sensor histidine kinase and response regulator